MAIAVTDDKYLSKSTAVGMRMNDNIYDYAFGFHSPM
jgi:hypothetical protein